MAKSGTVYFAPGETSKIITITIKGDTKKEKDETFYVRLSGAVGATITDSQGVGTIVNNDGVIAKRHQMSVASAIDAALEELFSGRRKKRGR